MSGGVPRIAAVGAGRMGRGIAIAFAYAGYAVDLIDLQPRDDAHWSEWLAGAQADVALSLTTLADLQALTAADVQPIATRVHWVRDDQADAAIGRADVIFEGVPETLDAKRSALGRIGRNARADAVVASTTSTILVTDLVAMMDRAQRLLNAHWLNPAYLIPLVELSPHAGTDPEVLRRLVDLLEGIGKITVRCAAAPGYIVPRLQALIMNEAARMIEEGVASAGDIDKATRYGLGLRFAAMGVVEFIDFGGVDILHRASGYLAGHLSAPRYTAPPIVARLMAQGHIGVKSGQGFYDHRDRDPQVERRDVLQRLLAMLRHVGAYRPPGDKAVS